MFLLFQNQKVKELCDVLVHRANVLLMKKHVASIKIDHSEVFFFSDNLFFSNCNNNIGF